MIANSPMNPFSSGNPIDDIVMIRNTIAYIGITLDSPPNWEISRVCRRS